MRNYYQDMKNLYDWIKPIRGRDEDVRPIGQRRRTWERIEMDGDVVACRLYNTQCVRYYPDGRIGVRTSGWSTPLTADFIHAHSPWRCFKRNNKLWVMVASETDKYLHYPVPDKGELQFRVAEVDGLRHWVPVGDVVIEKLVVNREKAKEARAPYRPFLQWAKTFLKMSDGWIMHETRKQAIGINAQGYHYSHLTDEMMELMLDEESYLKVLCHIFNNPRDAVQKRLAESVPYEAEWGGQKRTYTTDYYDMQFEFKLLQGRVYRMLALRGEYFDKVQVKATTRTQSGIV